MDEYGVLTQPIRKELEDIVGAENVSSKTDDLEKHAIDESLEPPHPPHVVVKPRSTEEVSEVMKIAYREKIPVTPQGSRTGLSGGSHPLQGGIALSLERMTEILEIDEENLMAVVEPGVLIMDLHEETEKLGLLYPPDPGQESGSLGGNISTNAGGVRGMKYGVTRDFVQGLEAVLPNGEIINVGGKLVKNSTAYSLLDLIIGSEGTLAIVTKAILRLVYLPVCLVGVEEAFPGFPELLLPLRGVRDESVYSAHLEADLSSGLEILLDLSLAIALDPDKQVRGVTVIREGLVQVLFSCQDCVAGNIFEGEWDHFSSNDL